MALYDNKLTFGICGIPCVDETDLPDVVRSHACMQKNNGLSAMPLDCPDAFRQATLSRSVGPPTWHHPADATPPQACLAALHASTCDLRVLGPHLFCVVAGCGPRPQLSGQKRRSSQRDFTPLFARRCLGHARDAGSYPRAQPRYCRPSPHQGRPSNPLTEKRRGMRCGLASAAALPPTGGMPCPGCMLPSKPNRTRDMRLQPKLVSADDARQDRCDIRPATVGKSTWAAGA